MYEPNYSNSLALIVGINLYKNAPPLRYAKNDAQAISKLLIDKFAFPKENITTLFDRFATRKKIKQAFLSFRQCDKNDRILFFFAGHGHTVYGNRGEVGCLLPVDGNTGDLTTLIQWNELINDTDLIPAKHIL